MCIALCTIVAHNIAQNRPDNFPSCPPDNHHCSDVYLRERGDQSDMVWNMCSPLLPSIPASDQSLWTTVVRRWVGTVTDWYQNQMLSYYVSRMPVCPSACRWHRTIMHAREWRRYKRQVQQFSAGFNGQSMKNLDPWHHPCYNWIYVITMRDITE